MSESPFETPPPETTYETVELDRTEMVDGIAVRHQTRSAFASDRFVTASKTHHGRIHLRIGRYDMAGDRTSVTLTAADARHIARVLIGLADGLEAADD